MKSNYIIDGAEISAGKFPKLFEKYYPVIKAHNRVLVHAETPIPLIIALLLCEKEKKTLILSPSYYSKKEVDNFVHKYHIDLLISGNNIDDLKMDEFPVSQVEDSESCICIFTTGTTGKPKLVKHSWESITASSRFIGERLIDKTWLMTYSPTGYAGLQIFFSATKHGGTIVYVVKDSFEKYCQDINKYSVKTISATPTFWRLLINSWPKNLPKAKLDQATLGGEIVTQDILDMVNNFFRPERLTHIYASSEVGTAIVVSDKKAGFPKVYLDQKRNVRLRIKDNILEVNSVSRMKGYVDGPEIIDSDAWLSTGDVLEEQDERYFFIGRNDGRINVGGSKVLPEEIEKIITGLNGVSDCIVYQKKNPIVGSLLAADIMLRQKGTKDVAAIKGTLRELLPNYKVPQIIKFVEKIRISDNGKKIRN